MKAESHQQLDNWLNTFNHFPKSDPLVDLNNTQYIDGCTNISWNNPEVQKLIKVAQDSIKNFGTYPMTKVQGLVTQIGTKKVNIPFKLSTINFEVSKIKSEVVFEEEDLSTEIINPYLIKILQENYDLVIPTDEWENADILLEKYLIKIEHLEQSWIGNYHPNRFKLRYELEQIALRNDYSIPLLEQINLSRLNRENLQLPQDELSLIDDDQLESIALFNQKNILVEGPPGTGKSQLLINLIGKSLINQSNIIVASAKQTALDVIKKRLKKVNLDPYVLEISASNNIQRVYRKLAQHWKKIEDYKPEKNDSNFRPTLHEQLQFKLDIWNQSNLIGNGDWKTFLTLESSATLADGRWILNPTDLPSLQQNLPTIEAVYKNGLHKTISFLGQNWGRRTFEQTKNNIVRLQELINALPLTYGITAFESLRKKHITFQLFQTEFAQLNKTILNPSSPTRTQIEKQVKKLEKLEHKVAKFQNENKHWKRIISLNEFEEFSNQTVNPSFFTRIKLKRTWKEFSVAPFTISNELISQELEERKIRDSIQSILQPLKQHGVENLIEAKRLLLNLRTFKEEQWERYLSLTTAETEFLAQWTSRFTEIEQLVKQFNWTEDIAMVTQIKAVSTSVDHLASTWANWSKLPSTIWGPLADCPTLQDYINNHLYTYWKNFEAHYPELATWKNEGFIQQIEKLKSSIKVEPNTIFHQITHSTKKQFDHYHYLLSTPSIRLKEEDKAFKKVLKKGKQILLKEFSKSKSHLPLLQLLSSEAKVWIDLLQPIHLTNPIQCASHIPLIANNYKIGIIDEASQLLAAHSAGILYRSSTILIAGDEQQMQPHQFFQKNNDAESLMQHARFILPSVRLKHHYRSEQPELIQFSNEHFYDSQLAIFPHQLKTKAIHHNFVEGQFIDRQNKVEAQKVVDKLIELMPKSKSIGIVSFSQNQTELIRNTIPNQYKTIVEEMENNGQLFILPLEKIQGDECDDLIISTTYSPNEEGSLLQKFGLMSLDGGRFRLNVLASRASKSMHVITSIKSAEINATTNVNTDTFKKWLQFVENQAREDENTTNYPRICIPIHESLTLREIVIRSNVFKDRGWEIEYV